MLLLTILTKLSTSIAISLLLLNNPRSCLQASNTTGSTRNSNAIGSTQEQRATSLRCKQINGVIFLVFKIPQIWTQRPTYAETDIYFSYFIADNCREATTSKLHKNKQWIYSTDTFVKNSNELVANIGMYETQNMLQVWCLRLTFETAQSNNETFEVTNFFYKNDEINNKNERYFQEWSISEQQRCFNSNKSLIRNFHALERCPNMTLEWTNYRYAQLWFIRQQRIELQIHKRQQIPQQELVYSYTLIPTTNTNTHNIVRKNERKVEYSACIVSITPDREIRKCKDVCVCCQNTPPPPPPPQSTVIHVRWLETLLIAIIIICAVLAVTMTVLYYRQRKIKQIGAGEITPRLCDINELTTYTRPLHTHGYCDIMETNGFRSTEETTVPRGNDEVTLITKAQLQEVVIHNDNEWPPIRLNTEFSHPIENSCPK